MNIEVDEENTFESKILTVHLISLEDAIEMCDDISHSEGPYAQVWSMGVYVTDNIENNLDF